MHFCLGCAIPFLGYMNEVVLMPRVRLGCCRYISLRVVVPFTNGPMQIFRLNRGFEYVMLRGSSSVSIGCPCGTVGLTGSSQLVSITNANQQWLISIYIDIRELSFKS